MDKALTKVFNKYTNFVNIFLPKLVIKFSKYISINNHAIKLVNNKQPLYGSIYSLNLIKLKTLKAYIKNNLANSFIRSFKYLIPTFIFSN